ncbi:O-antigen ligase family protein, partial [Candidatus Saccharibacteria bacterium]|nr:O-antigen ligase family protein [Candidatus Saccharibacteria bacterium]
MRITRAQLRPAIEHLVVCGVALFIVCAVLPVPTLGFELPKFVAFTAGATLAALILIFSKQPVLSFVLRNRIGMAFAMFMGVIVLSLLWSVAPIASLLGVAPRFHGVLTYVALGTLALMAMVLASQNQGLALLRRGVLTINIVVVLYGLLQMLALDPLGHLWQSEAFLGRTFSLLGHPNALAQCIVLTLPFVGLAWSRTEERVERLWWLMLVVLNCTVLFATASRSGLLGLLLLGLLCSSKLKVYLRTQRDRIKPEQAFALSLIVVLCCSIGFVFFTQRFASSFETGRSSSARVEIWETMLEMFGDRPIGWGLETLSFTSPRFLTKNIYAYESLTAVIDRAHNELMQLLVTAGPLALVSYVWLIVLLLHTAWRERKYDETGMIRASASAIAAFQVTLLFGFPTIAT